MCGRFTQNSEMAVLEERFGVATRGLELKPRYNLAPGQDASVIIQTPERRLTMMRWGLVPAWSKDPFTGPKPINARAESAPDKPSFRQAFRRRRCLVPADGFYEWRLPEVKGGPKVPLIFCRRDRAPFAMAGLWESWHGDEGLKLLTFTILTTEANDLIRPVHDRMPVILLPENESLWLDPNQHDPQALAHLVQPYPDRLMEAYEVSPAINSPAHEGPELIAPVVGIS
jgi:putative SOS response-associated peptidase YedK